MRIDHHAYQRATKVAGFGLLLQLVIGIALFIFGLTVRDSAFQVAAGYVVPGILVWVGLIILFYQHKLERLEALEEDELAATSGAGAFFERQADESHVAARRLALMHKWLMPGLSLLLALVLGGLAWLLLRYMQRVNSTGSSAVEFLRTDERGWAVAICLSVAAVSFIFSRFVAGMAKQPVWQNLRGGAAYMVGNALIMIAVAAGIIFRFFENQKVIEAIAYGIPIFMLIVAAEIILNFILNLYRPRIPGEVPRPAFDSKVLSLFAAPDSIVRSLNEAVNYQFGFDVTSSWGYQLLLRSFVSLLILGIVAMAALSTMVIVEPNQQAVKLRGGRIIGEAVYSSGVLWKWPWPFESAEVHDVTRIRNLHLTAKVKATPEIPEERRFSRWDKEEPPETDETITPFIVGSARTDADTRAKLARTANVLMESAGQEVASVVHGQRVPTVEDTAAEQLSAYYSLVDTEIVLEYRIRQDGGGLLQYLTFASEAVARRQDLTDRERALKLLVLAQVSAHLSGLSLDEVLSPGRTNVTKDLRDRVQAAFDAKKTGVEVVAVTIPMLRPSGESAPRFEELNISTQARLERLAQADGNVVRTFTWVIGDAVLTDKVLAGIDRYDELERSKGHNDVETIKQRQEVESLLVKGGGGAAQMIAAAETERWNTLMAKEVQARRFQGQLAAYHAAPQLYMQREIMRTYGQYLPVIDKYIIAIDPSRISVDIDWKKIAPNLTFAGASEEETKRK